MRLACGIPILVLATALTAAAQGGPAPAAAPIVVPDGVRISAVLSTSIDAEHSKPGTPITLESTADVRGSKGEMLIPKHAKLTGKVTEAIPWTKAQPESRLSIVVERAEWKSGAAVLRAFIVGKLKALASPSVAGGRDVLVMMVPGTGGPGAPPPPPPDTIGVNPGPYPDATCKLRVADDPALASEVVSAKHSVYMDSGSTFDLLNAPNQ